MKPAEQIALWADKLRDVSAIIDDEGRILLIQRADNGLWAISDTRSIPRVARR